MEVKSDWSVLMGLKSGWSVLIALKSGWSVLEVKSDWYILVYDVDACKGCMHVLVHPLGFCSF